MKLSCIFTILALSNIVRGAWWAAAMQPIAVTLGAAFAAFNGDVQPLLDLDLKKLIIFKQEKDETERKEDEARKEAGSYNREKKVVFEEEWVDPRPKETVDIHIDASELPPGVGSISGSYTSTYIKGPDGKRVPTPKVFKKGDPDPNI